MGNKLRRCLLIAAMLCLFAVGGMLQVQAQSPVCPPGRLIIGAAGRVTATHSVNLRDTPSTRGKLLFVVTAGETFIVLSGPQCVDGYQWWLVNWNSVKGWLPEGFGTDYWLEPLTAGGQQPTAGPQQLETPTATLPPVIAPAPDAQTVLPANLQKITAANVSQLKRLATWGHGSLSGMALSPDGKTLAVASGVGISLIPTSNLGAAPRELRTTGRILDLAFNADGTQLASTGTQLLIWNVSTGTVITTFSGDAASAATSLPGMGRVAVGVAVMFSPDGQHLATIDGQMDATQLWDIATGKLQSTVSGFTQTVFAAALSGDGKWLASTSLERKLIITDVATGAAVQTLTVPVQTFSLAFSPDNKTLIEGENNGAIELRDTSTWQVHNTLRAQRDQITGLHISADGKYLASASEEGTAVIWDFHTLLPLKTLNIGVPLRSYMALLSPDGQAMYTGSIGSIDTWNTSDGVQRQSLKRYSSEISSLRFSGDGEWLATSNNDGTARLWNVKQASQTLMFNVAGAQAHAVVLDATG